MQHALPAGDAAAAVDGFPLSGRPGKQGQLGKAKTGKAAEQSKATPRRARALQPKVSD
jgi:hypothetical protein